MYQAHFPLGLYFRCRGHRQKGPGKNCAASAPQVDLGGGIATGQSPFCSVVKLVLLSSQLAPVSRGRPAQRRLLPARTVPRQGYSRGGPGSPLAGPPWDLNQSRRLNAFTASRNSLVVNTVTQAEISDRQ